MSSSVRILVIDDDIELLEMMRIILEKAGFLVDKADNGELGIQLAQKLSPDLIILDVMMPRMDGLAVCRYLRTQKETRQTPIIMMSALGDVDDRINGFTAGADDYVPKPVNPKELILRVFALLNRVRMARSWVARTFSFVGAKGGVGTTTVALNIAARLAHQRHRVVLAELRPSGGMLQHLLRFKTKIRDISPLLALDPAHIKRPEVERCLVAHSSGMQVLMSPSEYMYPITKNHIEAIFDVLSANTDYIIFDLPTQLESGHRRALELSDQILLVTEPESISVKCARNQIEILRRWGVYDRVNMVVVERTPLATGLNRVEVENRTGMGKPSDPDEERWNARPLHIAENKQYQGVVCTIPTAPDLFHETAQERVPLMLVDPNARPAHALLDLVDWLTEQDNVLPMFGADPLPDKSPQGEPPPREAPSAPSPPAQSSASDTPDPPASTSSRLRMLTQDS